VAGGVVGGLAAVGLVAVVVWRARQKRRPRRRLLHSNKSHATASWRGSRPVGAGMDLTAVSTRELVGDVGGNGIQVTRNPMDTVLLTLMHTGGGDVGALAPPAPVDPPTVTRNVLLGAALGVSAGEGGYSGSTTLAQFAPIPTAGTGADGSMSLSVPRAHRVRAVAHAAVGTGV